MHCLLAAALLLTAVQISVCASPGAAGLRQRLARVAGPPRQGSSLARALEGGTSALARRAPDDLDFEDEEENLVGKRQFDDYGHMRFGRSGPKFDDYIVRYGK